MAFNLFDLGQALGGAAGAVNDYNQKSTLDALGQDLAGGDYKTASRKLLALGQIGPAVHLMNEGQKLEQQKAADAAILPMLNGGGLSALGGAAAPAPAPAAPASAPAGGGAFNVSRAFELAKQAGASDDEAKTLAAIAQAESSGNPQAHNTRGPDDSYGLWQINMKGALGPERMQQFGLSSPDQLYDPATNAKAAVALMRGRGGFGDWSTYNNGAYKPFLGNGGPVQVADASGAVPASAVPAAGPDLEGQRAALMQRRASLGAILAQQPNASDRAKAAINNQIGTIDLQLQDLTRREALQNRREDRQDQRRYEDQRRIDEMKFRDQQRQESAKDRAAQREAELANKAPTGEQANAATFATRMAEAEKIISDPAIYGAALGARGIGRSMAESVPIVGNALSGVGDQGPAYQQYRQAQRDFANAVLRKESGAAISSGEFANAEKQYFPQPGDSAEVIAQKAKNRATAIDTIAGAGAPGFVKEFRSKRAGVAASAGGPAVGAVEDGYKFKGGNPADPASWEQVR